MSSLIIDKFKVEAVEPAFNSDNLDSVTITGWRLVTQRNKYKVGDEVIHIPIQTILSVELNDKLFPEGSKIKLQSDRRIRTIKIRKNISQGMILDPKEFDLEYVRSQCTKWQPPTSSLPGYMNAQIKKPKPEIKSFVKYTDIENGKYYDRCLKDGEQVVITCKLHGTSSRYGWHKYEANVWYQKILKFLHLTPEWVFCYGSRNVQLQSRLSKKNYYEGDVYGKILKQYNLKEIPKGFSVYGEIVGYGIQKGYSYGCDTDEHKLYVYDVRDNVNGKWLDHGDMIVFCQLHGLTPVPLMYSGPYSQDLVKYFIDKNPISKEVNEGIVLKYTKETIGPMGRFILKFINDEYYTKQDETGGTEFQ
jgi:RNA ligase (TIGR02306 family)